MKKILSMIRVDVNLVWFWYLLVTAVSLGLSAVLFLTATGSAVSGQEAGTEVCVTLAQTAENSHFFWVFLVGLFMVLVMTEMAWMGRKNGSRFGYLLCRLNMSHRQIFAAHVLFHILLIAGYWGIFQLMYVQLAGHYMARMEAAGALGLNSQTIVGAGFQYNRLLSFLPVGMPGIFARNILMITYGAISEAAAIVDMPYGSRKKVLEYLSSIWVLICVTGEPDRISTMLYMALFVIIGVVIICAEVFGKSGELYVKEESKNSEKNAE